MQSKMPRTPFATKLSDSAAETELRIKSIFQWDKKRVPLLLCIVIVFCMLYCFGLVAIIPDGTASVKVGGIPTVLSLNDYYTVEEIERLTTEHGLSVQTVYLWEPGETGKLMFRGIENNDIRGRLDWYLSGWNERDPGYTPEELARLKVYAITTTAPIWKVAAFAASEPIIARVDSMSFPIRQNFEKPVKPDGAL